MMQRYRSKMGRFYLEGPQLVAVRFGDCESDNFKRVMALMGQVLIIQARDVGYMDAIEYLGISPLFDELEEGAMIPEYTFEGCYVEDKDAEGKVVGNHYEVKAFRRADRCRCCGAPQK